MSELTVYTLSGEVRNTRLIDWYDKNCYPLGQKVRITDLRGNIYVGFWNTYLEETPPDNIEIINYDFSKKRNKLSFRHDRRINVPRNTIVKVEAILYSNPRWGAQLTNEFVFNTNSSDKQEPIKDDPFKNWSSTTVRTFVERSMSAANVLQLDHLVITVNDLNKSIGFFRDVLGMKVLPRRNNNHTRTLSCGQQLIRLQTVDRPQNKIQAASQTPGSYDLCFRVSGHLLDTKRKLQKMGIKIVEGPVDKYGVSGEMTSLYIRDPDNNLIELAFYDD